MHVSRFDPAYRDRLSGVTNQLVHAGMTTPDAARQAVGRIYTIVQTQASTEAYLDTLKIIGIMCLCMLPLMMLLRKNDPHAKRAMAHCLFTGGIRSSRRRSSLERLGIVIEPEQALSQLLQVASSAAARPTAELRRES